MLSLSSILLLLTLALTVAVMRSRPASSLLFISRTRRCLSTLLSMSTPTPTSVLSAASILAQPIIASDANERVKTLKALQTKKKREQLNLVVLEGHRHIIDALSAGLVPVQVLLTERALLQAPLSARLLESLQEAHKGAGTTGTGTVPQVHCVEEGTMAKIADTSHSQGIVASFPRPSSLTRDAPLLRPLDANGAPLVLLLDRPTDPGNVGTILRSSFGLGADSVVVIDGCDVWSPKVLRSSMGMALQFPVAESGWDDVPAVLARVFQKGSIVQILLAVADESAIQYTHADLTLPTVLVIGSEATGIGPEAEGLATTLYLEGSIKAHVKRVRIPTARPLESFNAAMAATILLAETARQRASPSKKK